MCMCPIERCLASAPAAGRPLTSKDLMKMMVRGEKVEVLKYLRTLPVEERGPMRRKLLKGLDVLQNRRNGETSSSSESGESGLAKRRQSDSADVCSLHSPSYVKLGL